MTQLTSFPAGITIEFGLEEDGEKDHIVHTENSMIESESTANVFI